MGHEEESEGRKLGLGVTSMLINIAQRFEFSYQDTIWEDNGDILSI